MIKRISVVVLCSLSALGGVVAGGVAARAYNSHWGPYTCNSCFLSTPNPDEATKKFINRSDMGFIIVPGDSVTVCGPTACVKYTRTNSGWGGGPVIPITHGNPGAVGGGANSGGNNGGNNGGGRGNSGGGYSGPGGSTGGGNVSVGPLRPERPPVDN